MIFWNLIVTFLVLAETLARPNVGHGPSSINQPNARRISARVPQAPPAQHHHHRASGPSSCGTPRGGGDAPQKKNNTADGQQTNRCPQFDNGLFTMFIMGISHIIFRRRKKKQDVMLQLHGLGDSPILLASSQLRGNRQTLINSPESMQLVIQPTKRRRTVPQPCWKPVTGKSVPDPLLVSPDHGNLEMMFPCCHRIPRPCLCHITACIPCMPSSPNPSIGQPPVSILSQRKQNSARCGC